MSPGIKLFHSPFVEPLLHQLSERLRSPLDDPFAPEIVVVPSLDMARFLKRELARTLGATGDSGRNGIVANITFMYPRQLVNATVDNPIGTSQSVWDAKSLTWTIVDTLLDDNKLASSVPGFAKSPLAVAQRTADLFDRYASHRPHMLTHWDQDGFDDGTDVEGRPNGIPKDQQWQAKLFRQVSDRINQSEVSNRALDDLESFARNLSEPETARRLPQRLSVFGVSTLSRAARQIIEVIAQSCETDIYAVFPCGIQWPSAQHSNLHIRSTSIGSIEVSHQLTKRWGAQSVEFANCYGQASGNYLTVKTQDSTVLEAIQKSIVEDSDLAPIGLTSEQSKAARSSSDGSLQIHACYGIARQAEALRDAILHELNNKPDLKLRDIAILCADVATAAPVLSAVFNTPITTDSSDEVSLPINVISNQASNRSSLIEAFLAVVHLITSRCSPAQVLDVAYLKPVSSTFGFNDEALALIATWADDLSVRYGLTADLRSKKFGIDSSINFGTWDSALNRLMMGIAVPGEEDRINPPGGTVPYDGISGSDMKTAGLIAEFIARIMTFVRRIGDETQITIEDFSDLISDLITNFLQVPRDEMQSMARLRSAVSSFQRDSENLSNHSGQTFKFAELVNMLTEYFAEDSNAFFNQFESITVAGLNDLEHIPYRVLAILGADEKAFSGSRSDGDDVLANNPCIGEPIYSLNGRQRLLTALLSTRETLIITCTGADVTNNKEVPLAVPIQELLEYTDALLHQHISDKKPFGNRQLLVRHPRQNFDSSTMTLGLFFADQPYTFDSLSKDAYEVLIDRNLKPNSVGVAGNSQRPLTSPAVLQPKDLIQVITNPIEFFVGNVLNVRIPQMPSSLPAKDRTITGDGIVNLTIDNLSRSGEGRGLLAKLANSVRPNAQVIDDWKTIQNLNGVLPPGKLGQLISDDIANELTLMLNELSEPLRDLGAGTDLDGEISIFGGRFPIRVENVHKQEQALVRVRYKRFNESLILGPWIELALLTLITQGARYEAHFVTRAVSDEKPIAFRRFELRGKTNPERFSNALLVLNCCEGMHRAASQGPIPYFEQASHELHKNSGAMHKVIQKFNKDIDYSAATNYFYADVDPEVVFTEIALPQDYADLNCPPGNPNTTRAGLFTEHVWKTFEQTTQITEARGGDTTENETENE